MKINWALFFSYLFVWIVVGILIFDNVIPMIIFIICGRACGGRVQRTKVKAFSEFCKRKAIYLQ